MTRLLHRINMGWKFLLALSLPLMAMTWFAASGVLERQQLATNMADLEEMTRISQRAGNLIHELQRERGMTAGFLSSEGASFGDSLPDQRRATDARLETFRQYLNNVDLVALDARLAARIDDTLSQLAATGALRQRIDGLEIPTGEAIAHYTEINNDLITVIGRMTLATEEASVSSRLTAYYSLLQAKELAGIERAVLSGAFSADAMTPATYQRLLTLVGQETAYHEAFDTLATPAMRERLRQVAESPEVARVEPLRGTAIALGTEGGYGVDAQQWFDWQTDKIDLLKEVEDAVAEDVLATAVSLRSSAFGDLIRHLLVAGLAAGLAVLLAAIIVRSIVLPLRRTLKAIKNSSGDLTLRLDAPGSDELAQLYRAFNESSANSELLVSNIKQGAMAVAVASSQINQGNQNLAQRTEEQSSSLVETASSMEQMTASVRQTADNARQAQGLSDQAASQATQGSSVASEARTAMAEIHAANREVTRIVEAIDNIAFQTNLLALNASVEAARAGEHGRGFAVVASEVRKLASRSAEEAEQIRQLIDNNVARIDAGERLVNATSDTLETIAERVQQVADIIAEMSTAAGEQSSGIEQINQAISQLEEVTQHNATLVEQVAAASRSLDGQAEDMTRLIARFKVSESPHRHPVQEQKQPQALAHLPGPVPAYEQ
ncbi:HAMP domain-containing protein [Halomonas campisalis]|uniref:HAMP domain-containing protein n=1 Tax=Billgrantia campisalis TaxID=74661 RepID=A0ABS9P391_9GAMM|nr:methyl-accepting chemotaxis protein [Halomonas campisalis]MCG6656241.1 HAMP domain-containing protein [Halomonas campisalis]MDR5861428.1 nitrate- and nitrite sensing domain-containing protein [Halomonas campisalis]